MIDDSVLKDNPEIEELFAPVSEALTDEVLIELNAKVDVEGQEPVDVAYEWLKSEGFIS